jgi:hypothetical protein
MSDTATIKQALVDLLKNDTDIQNVLGKDREGNYPVYLGFEQILQKPFLPCITVDDSYEEGDVSGLNDGYDGSNYKEWYWFVAQIDCWAKTVNKRDSITSQVKKSILKGKSTLRTSGGVIMIQDPSVVVLNELDRKPAIFRKSVRYRIFYILEAS